MFTFISFTDTHIKPSERVFLVNIWVALKRAVWFVWCDGWPLNLVHCGCNEPAGSLPFIRVDHL